MLKEIEDKIFPFRFRCVRCGTCCTRMPGGVPLYYRDIENIARRIGCGPKGFIERYCELRIHRIAGGNNEPTDIPVLYLKLSGRKCIFHADNGCFVHEVKPYICAASPFVSLLFQDDDTVEFFKRNCKGFGRGAYHSKKRIKDKIGQEIKLEEAEWRLFNNGFYGNLIKPAEIRKEGK